MCQFVGNSESLALRRMRHVNHYPIARLAAASRCVFEEAGFVWPKCLTHNLDAEIFSERRNIFAEFAAKRPKLRTLSVGQSVVVFKR